MRKGLVLLVVVGAFAAVGLVPTLSGAFTCTTPAADAGDSSLGPAWYSPVTVPPGGNGDAGFAVAGVSAEGDGTAGPPPSGYLSVKANDAGFTITGTVGGGVPGFCFDTSP